MLQNVQNIETTDQKHSKSVILPDLNDHHAPTNKLVIQECTKFRKGASRAGNKLFYWYSLNKKKGIYHTDFFLSVLADQMDCSLRTAERWIKELCDKGLFTLKKIRYPHNKVQYRMSPTDKFLKIKACGTITHRNDIKSLRQNDGDQPAYKDIYNIKNNTVLTKVEFVKTAYKNIFSEQPSIQRNDILREHLVERKKHTPSIINSEIPIPVAKACLMIFRELSKKNDLSFSGISWKSFEKACARLIRSHFGSVAVWRQYLESIFGNDYLMGRRENSDGSRFFLKIEMILSSKLADMFLEKSGYFQVWARKNRFPIERKSLAEEKLPILTLDMIEKELQSTLFSYIYISLFQSLGEKTYQHWIVNSGFVPLRVVDGKPLFTTKAKFYHDYIMNNFGDSLQKAFLLY